MSYRTTKFQALETARAAKMRMRRPGMWRVDVWENLGWCWCLEHAPSKAALTVWGHGGKFIALLSLACPRAGDPRWSGKHCNSPQKAVDTVVAMAKKTIEADVAKLKSMINP